MHMLRCRTFTARGQPQLRVMLQLPGVHGLPGPSVYGGAFVPTVDSAAQAAAEGQLMPHVCVLHVSSFLLKGCAAGPCDVIATTAVVQSHAQPGIHRHESVSAHWCIPACLHVCLFDSHLKCHKSCHAVILHNAFSQLNLKQLPCPSHHMFTHIDGALQVEHLTFLEQPDQQTLPAMISCASLSSMRVCQTSISILMTSLSRAGPSSPGPLQALPSTSQTAMRLASSSLACRSAVSISFSCQKNNNRCQNQAGR